MKYPAYSKYKKSGVEWLDGDGSTGSPQGVPEHWEVKRLKFILQEPLQYGANEAAELDDPELPRFVRITDVDESGNLRDETFRSLPEEIAKPFLLDEGDLLFARSGATVGKTFFYRKTWGRAAYAGYLIRARFKKSIVYPDFMNFITKSSLYSQWISSILIQATIQNVSAEKYASYVVPLPPLSEQQTIAAFLDRETGRIDSLIDKKQKLIELLKEKRTALISRAVTKGLNPKVKMKPSGVEWLGDVPEHWEVKKTRFLFSFISGGTPSTEEPDYWSGDVPWVSSKDMKIFYIEDTEDHISPIAVKESATNVIPKNTLLLVMRSGILQHTIPACVIKRRMAINQDIKAFIPKVPVSSAYYARLIEGNQKQLLTKLRKEGATVESLDMELIKNLPIPLPPHLEQQAIAAFLDRETGKIDVLVSKVETVIEKLNEYRTALISAAVTGKIDVSTGLNSSVREVA